MRVGNAWKWHLNPYLNFIFCVQPSGILKFCKNKFKQHYCNKVVLLKISNFHMLHAVIVMVPNRVGCGSGDGSGDIGIKVVVVGGGGPRVPVFK